MRKIDLSKERYDHDGVAHDKAWIENWFTRAVNPSTPCKNSIAYRLDHIKILSAEEGQIRDDLLNDLDAILLADPSQLDVFRRSYGARLNSLPEPTISKQKKRGRRPGTFKDKLLYAFGYSRYRNSVLVKLASYLNVKTCPYCNLHYTLSIRDFNAQSKEILMAKMQFDHYFDKATYPFLSMSLYNLIPSCPICNQGKSQRLLSLDFHPYYADIHKTFKFEVVDPLSLYVASNDDRVELKLVPQTGVDISRYDQTFHIKALYERHKDVAQEEFAKAYMNYYYGNSENFNFISDMKLRGRLIYGHYHDENDINERPMTKFKQDLWEQALRNIGLIKLL